MNKNDFKKHIEETSSSKLSQEKMQDFYETFSKVMHHTLPHPHFLEGLKKNLKISSQESSKNSFSFFLKTFAILVGGTAFCFVLVFQYTGFPFQKLPENPVSSPKVQTSSLIPQKNLESIPEVSSKNFPVVQDIQEVSPLKAPLKKENSIPQKSLGEQSGEKNIDSPVSSSFQGKNSPEDSFNTQDFSLFSSEPQGFEITIPDISNVSEDDVAVPQPEMRLFKALDFSMESVSSDMIDPRLEKFTEKCVSHSGSVSQENCVFPDGNECSLEEILGENKKECLFIK